MIAECEKARHRRDRLSRTGRPPLSRAYPWRYPRRSGTVKSTHYSAVMAKERAVAFAVPSPVAPAVRISPRQAANGMQLPI